MSKGMGRAAPKTFVFEIRADVRTVASLLSFFEKEKVFIRSRSELGSEILEYLLAILIANDRVEKFESSPMAQAYLEEKGLGISKAGRGREALARQIHIEQAVGVPESDVPMEETDEDLAALIMRNLYNG